MLVKHRPQHRIICLEQVSVRGSALWTATNISIFKRGFRISAHQCAKRATKHDIKSLYVDSFPPSIAQTKAANHFFKVHAPTKSWTAKEWRWDSRKSSEKAGGSEDSQVGLMVPEVIFLGRSNTGKSSLLNALLNSPGLCRVGAKPGKTQVMHAWSLAAVELPPGAPRAERQTYYELGGNTPRLAVLDMPGYGHGSHGEWGTEIVNYLRTRRQLRRAFVLVNPDHGLKQADIVTLKLLRDIGLSHQLIACKCDRVAPRELAQSFVNLKAAVEQNFGSSGNSKGGPVFQTMQDILAVGGLGDGSSSTISDTRHMYGLEDVRWAVIRAAGLEEYALALLNPDLRRHLKDLKLPSLPSDTEMLDGPKLMKMKPPSVSPDTKGAAAGGLEANLSKNSSVTLQQKKVSTELPIGIGIDDLLSMTTPEILPSKDTSRKLVSEKARVSRRALLRDRRRTVTS